MQVFMLHATYEKTPPFGQPAVWTYGGIYSTIERAKYMAENNWLHSGTITWSFTSDEALYYGVSDNPAACAWRISVVDVDGPYNFKVSRSNTTES
jgi:hypothetical protein